MKNDGLLLWNATAICEMFKTSNHMENTFRKAIWRTTQRSSDSVRRNDSIIFLFLLKNNQDSTRLVSKSFTWNSPRICSAGRENLERIFCGRRH